ncbi:MAG: helix-turn-helix domain-containing protein [Solirubrobacteraceae bacterium]
MSGGCSLGRVRELRALHYTPAEIARALAISKSEAAQLVRAVAAQSIAETVDAGEAGDHTQCWVNPGWRHGLRIDGHDHWPGDAGSRSQAGDSGVAVVMIATPVGHDRLQMCTFLVDTWCLGVKNAMGPKRMRTRELKELRRQCYAQWHSDGIAVPLELGQHLVLDAVEFAQQLGFEPHPDFRPARPGLGNWEGPSAITFGMNGKPHYINGPYEDPQHVLATLEQTLATLERTVGRERFHYTVSLGEADDLDIDDGYRYLAILTDRDQDQRDAA